MLPNLEMTSQTSLSTENDFNYQVWVSGNRSHVVLCVSVCVVCCVCVCVVRDYMQDVLHKHTHTYYSRDVGHINEQPNLASCPSNHGSTTQCTVESGWVLHPSQSN